MTKALLFDLDGTLLPVDTEKFVEHYMRALAPHVINYLPPDMFSKVLWKATHEMMKDMDSTKTNEEVFTKHFTELTGIQRSDIWPVFDRFYDEHFPKLKQHTEPSEISKDIVILAKEQGHKVVIATNPVFPKSAIYERLNWLGLKDFPFDLVTVYEDSHFCKPTLHYYEEVLNKIGVQAKDAIMIGNDMQEDMVASQLGMKTYLVTDYLIDRKNPTYNIDQSGNLKDLKAHIMGKEGVFNF